MGKPRKALVEALAEAMHMSAYYGAARPWKGKYIPNSKVNPLDEGAKEEWRYIAHRFIEEIAPKTGVKFSLKKGIEMNEVNKEPVAATTIAVPEAAKQAEVKFVQDEKTVGGEGAPKADVK